MARQHHGKNPGMCTHQNSQVYVTPSHAYTNKTISDITQLIAVAVNYFWAAYSTLNGPSYVAIATVILIVLLSFVLPDLSQKIHRTSELKAMKEVLQMMSKEVSKAEVACLTVADEVCCLHCSMHDGTTETFKYQQDLAMGTSGCLPTTQSAPEQADKKSGFFRSIFFPKKNSSNKMQEETIMSFLYTDSFNAEQLTDSNSDSN